MHNKDDDKKPVSEEQPLIFNDGELPKGLEENTNIIDNIGNNKQELN